MNEIKIKYKIHAKLCYVKKEVDGDWIDDKTRPAMLLQDKYNKFKIPIQNVPQVIEELQERLKEYEARKK